MGNTAPPYCVSIGPYGASEQEQQYRKSLEIVLHEAVSQQFEYKPFWSLPKIDMAGDIFKALVEAELVIADLRGLNPNVMYELGIRHAFNKPILHLIDPQTELPWDIDKNYTLTYPSPIQVSDKEELVKKIQEKVVHVMSLRESPDPSFNTFHRIYKSVANIQHLSEDVGVKTILMSMNEQIQRLSSRLDEQESSRSGSYLIANVPENAPLLASYTVSQPREVVYGKYSFPTTLSGIARATPKADENKLKGRDPNNK